MGSIQTSVNQQKSVLRIQAIGSGFTDIQVDRVDDAHPKRWHMPRYSETQAYAS
jgi:hypothetical protein